MNEAYKKQVSLLLSVLPEVAKESCFALHGETAINLFIREMPRLSVDIDLTYIFIEDRQTTLSNISAALIRIKDSIKALKPTIRIKHLDKTCKLQISDLGAQIKIEVNMVNRGILSEPVKLPLCKIAQDQFDVFCTINLMLTAQIYGGKICAALDRQHPRDLFDIKLLFDHKGFTEDIKHGILFGLLSSDRPTYELLAPRKNDQRLAFINQFEGMTNVAFSYEEYEQTLELLIKTVNSILKEDDKQFLLGVNSLEPDWSLYDFKKFPSIQWKLQNLANLKKFNQQKFNKQSSELRLVLYAQ